MIELGVNVIVLRIKNNTLGDVADISVMGKTLENWAALCVDAPHKAIEASPVIDLADKIKAAADRTKPVTVLLYCDTPLVTQKTVSRAIEQLKANNADSVKLPRGCVYRTEFLFNAQSVYMRETGGSGEFEPVTDGESLSRMTDTIRKRILRYHAENGVIIRDFANTYIDCDVVIGRGAVIEPYNFIKGKSMIKSGVNILPGNYIENCIIESGARIDSSRLYDSLVGEGTRVGPFAYLRPNSVVGANCRIGDFVELKNCVIGDGSKVSHLTYVGDAELGSDCNVGCGVVFANYDGKNKYRSVVGNRVFIGSNANIVAPVTIADRAFIAAGSTITKAVPSQALAIARARQTLIPDWSGNMYAPPAGQSSAAAPKTTVRFSDGIIDGTATDRADRADNVPDGE